MTRIKLLSIKYSYIFVSGALFYIALPGKDTFFLD